MQQFKRENLNKQMKESMERDDYKPKEVPMEEVFVAKECNLCGELKFKFIPFEGKRICLKCWNNCRDENSRVDQNKIRQLLKEKGFDFPSQ